MKEQVDERQERAEDQHVEDQEQAEETTGPAAAEPGATAHVGARRASPPSASATADEDPLDALMARSRDRYSSRWGDIQAKFVDEPSQAVQDADRLVEEVLEQVFEACAGERERLAQSWSNGGTDTETMRTTLQRYRRVFAFVLR